MSRHKLFKTLDLDEELEDFDGAGDDNDADDLSPEDKEHLRRGTIDVRNSLGPGLPVTDGEIQDSLYYYYYDVPKTVNYLLNQYAKSVVKEAKKKSPSVGRSMNNDLPMHYPTSMNVQSCVSPFSIEEFFKDSPWLKIPKNRRGVILIEPLHPYGGLLGGSLISNGPPKSKLAALAAARKRKENQKLEDGAGMDPSVSLLDKLSSTPREAARDEISTQFTAEGARSHMTRPKKYPVRKRKDSGSPPSESPPTVAATNTGPVPDSYHGQNLIPVPAAGPSSFANVLFGPSNRQETNAQILQPSFSPVTQAESRTNIAAFAGPSPDDLVLRAQNSSKGSRATKISQKDAHECDREVEGDLAEKVNATTFNDVPKVKSKNLNVLHEYHNSKWKNAANFVVIGHVDAGKSTLMGRLLHDLRVVDQRTVDKYRKEAEKMGKGSFALAWVLDQGTEERERGVTIDIAMKKFETEKTSFTILDAPGHRDFIPNMIAGASQADFAILVIDASTGNFESGLKGQTKEHALLVRSMGVQRVVVAVNKLDAVQWSQDRFDEISQQISAFLTGAGFLAKNLWFVPCSGLLGDNIVRKAADPLAAWYTGPSLISLLESSEPITRALEKPLRLTVDDIFRGGVQNPLSISGRIDSGTIQVGDVVVVTPAAQTAIIKSLDVDSQPADWAVAGQNVILHLADIEASYIRSGDVICLPSSPVKSITTFTVKVLAFEHIMPMHCEVHKGRLHVPGRVTQLVAVLEKSSGAVMKGKKPKLIKPGSVAKVVIETEEAIPLEGGSRVILRAGGETIGAGLLE